MVRFHHQMQCQRQNKPSSFGLTDIGFNQRCSKTRHACIKLLYSDLIIQKSRVIFTTKCRDQHKVIICGHLVSPEPIWPQVARVHVGRAICTPLHVG